MSVCTVDKSKVKILQNFVAFSEYTNFKRKQRKIPQNFELTYYKWIFLKWNEYCCRILVECKTSSHLQSDFEQLFTRWDHPELFLILSEWNTVQTHHFPGSSLKSLKSQGRSLAKPFMLLSNSLQEGPSRAFCIHS